MSMRAPIRLLISEQTMVKWQAAIVNALGTRPHEFVLIDQAVTQQRRDLDVAFISRDVTGLSTKHQFSPQLQACYDVLRRSSALQWVHIHSAGADRPIYVELRKRGVMITTSSGANAEVVAQSALAGVLALARQFPQLWRSQQEHRWTPLLGKHLPRDLEGQTAMVIGWGPIGQRISALLRHLGLRIIAVRTRDAISREGIEMITFEDMHQALPHTDFLILACPLTEKTRQMIGPEVLASLPAGANLINVARGEIVDQQALTEALKSGRLGGAFLDVFEHEPLPPEALLWDLPNVIVTPHSAGHSDGNETRVAHQFLDNLQRWCSHQALHNIAHEYH